MAALGPAAATTERFLDVVGRMREGDDSAAVLLRAAVQSTPFINMFYTRAALDYLFLYRIAETLNPGYLRRMEQRVERDNAQQFLIRPSTVSR